MKIRQHLLFACTGWIAGVCIILGARFIIIPAVMQNSGFSGGADLLILGIVIVLTSPAALVGGIMGGRLTVEGGQNSQLIAAAIVGMIMAIPFSCIGFWITGG